MSKNQARLLQVLLPFAALLVVGCTAGTPAPAAVQQEGEKPQYGGVFISQAATDDAPSFDFHRESVSNLTQVFSPAYDLIIRKDPSDRDKTAPDLAERWEFSPDGKTVMFSIRKGVKFHNGDALTSADVKFTLDRIRGAITQGPGALAAAPRKGLMKAVDKVETPDDSTVVVKMQYPQASFFGFLTLPFNAVYSKQWIEAGHNPAKEINGTGAFKFKQYISGTSGELVKNEQYWNPGLPYLDGVKTFIIPDAGTRLAALRTGQMMIMGVLSPAQERTLRAAVEKGEAPLNLIEVPKARGSGVNLTLNTSSKPFDDPRVRKAVTLAVDRNDLVKAAGAQGAVLGGWLGARSFWALPPGELEKIPGYGKDKAAERAEAKRLLAEAGYPNGLSLKAPIRRDSEERAIIWFDQLKKIGIDLELRLMDTSIYEVLEKGDFGVTFISSGSGVTDDPDTNWGQYFACGAPRNWGNWCDPKFEEMYAKQSQTLDQEARRKLVWEIEKYVLEQAPKLPIGYFSPDVWAANKQVRGWIPQHLDDQSYRLDTVWLAK